MHLRTTLERFSFKSGSLGSACTIALLKSKFKLSASFFYVIT